MIIATERDEINWREGFLICLQRPVTEALMLSRAKVQAGSYAAGLVALLYDALFRRSLDLKYDYDRYFRIEYPNFHTYLAKRYSFGEPVNTQVAAEVERSSMLIYYEPGFCFLDDEGGIDFLASLLEPRRVR